MEPLRSYFGYRAEQQGAIELTQGNHLPDHIASQLIPETRAIFATISDLASKDIPPISPKISPDQFKSCYKAMDERTSSSPSGRHLGHYKTATFSDELSNLHSIMMSIPPLAGIAPTKWQQIVNVMLEKK
jgi:hypothetical protein